VTDVLAHAPRRVVAIVGRPNVGKSALFNRLAGRRLAIVHEQSGVTRDRLVHEVVWNDQRFDLIDTGGIAIPEPDARADDVNTAIRAQAEAAIGDATVVILTVDITAGSTALDEDVARLLRRHGRTTVVAANKADAERLDLAAADFARLGFPVFPVSALHDRGIEELMQRVLRALPDTPNPTVENPLRVAVVGRPNVGKSSFINALLQNDRVIVSEVPGTTRDSIPIPFSIGEGPQARHYVLIDTAGMRHTTRVDNAVERFSHMRAEESIRRADVVVHVLDAAQGPREQDKKVAAMIRDHARGCVLLVNKWDLLKDSERKEYSEALARVIPFAAHYPVVYVSAKTGLRVRQCVEAIDRVAAHVRARLPTGMLNRTLADAYARVQPPMIQGKRLKIFYATQVGTSPIRVRLFVNDPRRITPAYREYLIRNLRRVFGLEGAPILLHLSERKREDDRLSS
jgi:GTP-binding protein